MERFSPYLALRRPVSTGTNSGSTPTTSRSGSSGSRKRRAWRGLCPPATMETNRHTVWRGAEGRVRPNCQHRKALVELCDSLGLGLMCYTIPMPDDSPIPGRNAEGMALNGSALAFVRKWWA